MPLHFEAGLAYLWKERLHGPSHMSRSPPSSQKTQTPSLVSLVSWASPTSGPSASSDAEPSAATARRAVAAACAAPERFTGVIPSGATNSKFMSIFSRSEAGMTLPGTVSAFSFSFLLNMPPSRLRLRLG